MLLSSLRLRNSWNYRSHRWVLFTNVACGLLALFGAISHYGSRVTPEAPPQAVKVLPVELPSQSLIERFEGHIKKNE
jgi:hypothetical protein